MTFKILLLELSKIRLNYLSLLYANTLLHSHLYDSKKHDCLLRCDFLICANIEPREGEFSLSSDFIINEINNHVLKRLSYLPSTMEEKRNSQQLAFNLYSLKPNERYNSEIITSYYPILLMSNAHFLRTRALNIFYETIKNWFVNNYLNEWGVLHLESWVQTLYLLRNIASHEGGGVVRKVKTLKRNKNNRNWLIESYPAVVNWENIRIADNQLENTVRYNDKEILDLFQYAIDYLNRNYRKYES